MADKIGAETQFLTEKEYVAAYGAKCPNCRSPDITGFGYNLDSGDLSQQMLCSNCDAQWDDIYTLTGYANLELDS